MLGWEISYRINLKSSSSAKIKREIEAAGITHCPILRFCVVLAEFCVFEGWSLEEKCV